MAFPYKRETKMKIAICFDLQPLHVALNNKVIMFCCLPSIIYVPISGLTDDIALNVQCKERTNFCN